MFAVFVVIYVQSWWS